MTAHGLNRLRKFCCAATCLDLNSTYKLLLINIKLAFVCKTTRHVADALSAGVVTTGGEMQGSSQFDSGVTVPDTGVGLYCA
jgi:hypothetical protein